MIREYRAEDLQDVLAAWAAANAVAHPFLSREFLAKVRHDIAHTYLPNTETWVWETEDRVVGFISMMGNEIGGLFIEPAFPPRPASGTRSWTTCAKRATNSRSKSSRTMRSVERSTRATALC